MTTRSSPVPLTAETLARLRPEITIPTYDRQRLRGSIVHIGVGGFHRSHLATYIHDLCRAGHGDWAIIGAGILPGDAAMASALGAQDHLYSLITRSASTESVEVIGSIIGYHHASPRRDALIDQIASPATQIVSLTVTEGGYPVDDTTGRYLPDSSVAGPESAFGLIASGLDIRRQRGGSPVTVMSCDNVMSNGSTARAATLGEAARISDSLEAWVSESVTFPNSMVDRITPATTVPDREWLAHRFDLADRWPVVTEPFRQWVIEDSFAGDRPPLEEVGVILTADVEPYEVMKLRLLNASHSCLAYLAALGEIRTVDAAIANPALHKFVVKYLRDEATPVLPPVANVDIQQYTAALVDRLANPRIGDQVARLCLDGSSKLPKFVLPTLRAQLAKGGPIVLTALALAGWCEYLNGYTQNGTPIDHADDPLLDLALEYARASRSDPAAFLALTEVFGTDLIRPGRFREAFVDAVNSLRSQGVGPAVHAALQDGPMGQGSR